MAASARREIEALRSAIREHDRRYHLEAKPSISDEAYDQLMRRLLDLEAAHPELVTPDSPSRRVGGAPTKKFPVARHDPPMMSLDNTYAAEEVRAWEERCRKGLPGQALEFVIEPKIDGVAVALIYEGGLLIRGAPRGDGEEGDDITGNLRTIRSVPLRLEPSKNEPALLEARGEAFFTRDAFAALNAEQEEAGAEPFA
ncbi:MAG: NAD-dependent DNA ligase LigA, partial [bacterium]